jgi:hypothetical protein
MGTVISNLKARFGVDTTDFKKGLKDGDKSLDDFTGAAGSKLDEFASMFGVNMSAVNAAIGTAGKSLNTVGQSLVGMAKGGDKAAISMKLLKTALISTGLGAIVVVLGLIIAYFSKTGQGADKFAKILMQVKSVVNNVIERLAAFGKGLWEIMTGKFKQGWQDMTGAFKGIGNEIKEDWKAAGDLADREDALEDREIALISSLEERRAKMAELRRLAKEETEDQKEKLKLLNQAENIIKGVYSDEISLEKDRLAIMKEKLAIQTKDPTDEQRREVAEQEAKINGLLRAQSDELRGLLREKNAALKIVKEELALEEAKAKAQGIKAVDVSNLKFPDFGNLQANLVAPMQQVQQAVKSITIDIAETLESALEGVASSFAEIGGAMLGGAEGMRGWGTQLVGNAFGDMLISLGKVAIQTGISIEAIKVAFKTLGGVGAIAAGIALIALGSAIKAKVSATFSTSAQASGAGGSGSGGAFTYDTRKQQPVEIHIKGELVGQGSELKAVIDAVDIKRNMVT